MSKPLIAIAGKSGSGKNYIARQLEKFGYSSVKSYTTRAIRVNDPKDKDTHTFITPDRVEDYKDDIVASTTFNNNFYFATRKQLNENDIYILDINGLKELRKAYKDKRIIAVYLKCNDDTLQNRMHMRGDSKNAVLERIKNDEIMFKDAEQECDFILPNETKSQAISNVEFIDMLLKYSNKESI